MLESQSPSELLLLLLLLPSIEEPEPNSQSSLDGLLLLLSIVVLLCDAESFRDNKCIRDMKLSIGKQQTTKVPQDLFGEK